MTVLSDKLTSLLGRKTAAALAEALDIHTVADLLRHYPRRYAERGELTDIAGLEIGEHATVMARIERVNKRRMRNKPGWIVEMTITDGRRRLECAFFGNAHQRERELQLGKAGLFAGKVTAFRNKLQLANPEYQMLDQDDDSADGSRLDDFLGAIIPVYPAASGMPSWSIARCVRQVLDTLEREEDPMPRELRKRYGFVELFDALHGIHRPQDQGALDNARERLKWDEAMAIQLIFAQRRHSAGSRPAPACPPKPGGILESFDKRLPFDLTSGQREVGEHIADDLCGEHPMNRLLQGEVGSGKTVVALRAMLQVVDAGRQAAMLAPTEVLAAQHARSLREMLGDLGQAGELGAADEATKVTLLTGSMSTKERKQALLDAASGAAGIVVGTHALIQDTVSFADLGFVVVDEQHRFGVEQRDALRTRGANDTSPHVLVMTATPIPRTVAMTVYGDLETSALRVMPVGRSPISTTVVPVNEKPAWLDRVWQRVREEVGKGHQAYIVCPRIGDEPPSDKSDKRPPLAVLDVAAELAAGPLAGLRIGILHGRLPSDEKDAVMRAFAAGKLDVLVATTVIEVGVNVPNATAMVIMDADRFGVSQLHQLRGRVGRGDVPGVCLLVTEAIDGTSTRERLAAVESTTDGFELSRLDLELRREGDILGAAQSGKRSSLKLLSLLQDEETIAEARLCAQEIVTADPALATHPGLAQLVSSVVDDDRAEYLEKS
ncbi:ATP-dependent DNA helicase RecG [Amycolatopsis acidiphila]|uniref:ATP-dependent DNA helicase RecG n=1 Tax=Amycolatopsis acidiphila TaxID=715473 RepID=A0A558AC18_9PSEU|nr:ATP-dependent DNA helicase RecG [Amycolatopsis acidiphila]TVT21804.1 ATP-dependent DNA helicase RecG [Amycolatopsis acidiphila]UIJ61524.1 ATP-dependent DNA helicase RecG [Amycolatopsis acidiphila]GHG59429.1 ATP-dependent DNA helicase RecG [Amycolatopsis acidiphila]